MRYVKEKKDSLANPGQTMVVFREINDRGDATGFAITASGMGIVMNGCSEVYTSSQDFEVLAKAIGEASQAYLQLKGAVQDKLRIV